MPSKTDTMRIPKGFDKRVKLTDAQRREIKAAYGSFSQRELAAMYNVSRRLIQFIGCPEKLAENLKRREERGGWAQYYDKEYCTAAQRKHRRYKRSVYKQLESENESHLSR